MQYARRGSESRENEERLLKALEPVIRGMGFSLIELTVHKQKGRGKSPGSVQIKAVIYENRIIGIEDCSKVHRAVMPRLELAFPGQDIYLEVSSPGIDRLIKDGVEFVHYIGREVRCYRTDISDWTTGVLSAVDEEKIVLRTESGETILPYETIAKARLSAAPQTNI